MGLREGAIVSSLKIPLECGLVGFQASQGASFGGGFAGPVEVTDIRLFHLPREERGLVVDNCGEVDDPIVGRAEDNAEAFEFLDVCFEVCRLRFQFILNFRDFLVVDLKF